MGRRMFLINRSRYPTPHPRRRLLASVVGALALRLILSLTGWPGRLWSTSPQADPASAARNLSAAAARALEAKIQALSNSDPATPAQLQPVVITDLEANSYLKYYGREFLPSGVHDPELHIHQDHVSGTAEVDFNALNQTNPKSDEWGDKLLAMILQGKQRVSVNGKLDTGNGQGKVKIEGVQLGTTELPDWLISALLGNYVQKKYNIDLGKPFVLPDHVTRIELGDGQATFYRSASKNR